MRSLRVISSDQLFVNQCHSYISGLQTVDLFKCLFITTVYRELTEPVQVPQNQLICSSTCLSLTTVNCEFTEPVDPSSICLSLMSIVNFGFSWSVQVPARHYCLSWTYRTSWSVKRLFVTTVYRELTDLVDLPSVCSSLLTIGSLQNQLICSSSCLLLLYIVSLWSVSLIWFTLDEVLYSLLFKVLFVSVQFVSVCFCQFGKLLIIIFGWMKI